MSAVNIISLFLTLAITTQVMSASASEMPAADTARHQTVLALKPVGYWPMNEGKGHILHDQSGNGNNGKLINTEWENGLLNFEGGYQ